MKLPKTPSFRLDGRRALVTGAGRGIGLAAAAALAEAGSAVTLVARGSSEIEAASALMDGEWAVLDVRDLAAVASFFESRPAFDILVNNAGTNRPKPMTEVSEDDFDAVLDLNLKSAFFVAQHCVKAMLREGKGGTLIHIGSQMGHVGGHNRSLYCASKWVFTCAPRWMVDDYQSDGDDDVADENFRRRVAGKNVGEDQATIC